MKSLDELIAFYENFSAADVARFGEFYSADAWFKDPFNEVSGLPAIQRIFTHMFSQVAEPRFHIEESIVADNGAMLAWTFHYRMPRLGGGGNQVMRGVSHLRFDAAGKVSYHRDYWDAAEELYMKLPAVGWLMRGLRRMISA
jgi:steroid Delta-isomerase